MMFRSAVPSVGRRHRQVAPQPEVVRPELVAEPEPEVSVAGPVRGFLEEAAEAGELDGQGRGAGHGRGHPGVAEDAVDITAPALDLLDDAGRGGLRERREKQRRRMTRRPRTEAPPEMPTQGLPSACRVRCRWPRGRGQELRCTVMACLRVRTRARTTGERRSRALASRLGQRASVSTAPTPDQARTCDKPCTGAGVAVVETLQGNDLAAGETSAATSHLESGRARSSSRPRSSPRISDSSRARP